MKFTPAQSAELVKLVSNRTGRARLAITGRSMRPLLQAGMVVDVEPLIEAPRVGDVLVFKSRAGLVAHRFVSGQLTFRDERSLMFITAGDAHPDRLEAVSPRLVVGRVAAVWSSASSDARRIDGPRYNWLGAWMSRTRKLRSFVVK